ncbi:hypothetical protein CRG98_008865 [Punica granatum]|uniref:Uncharacterized protein n=1 Tax=Punica granatum TaxID=22663 RepID=A0A2I0KQ83_PUNGR|nr:hypothetical protein CRG98_008865 [Punica granatum]
MAGVQTQSSKRDGPIAVFVGDAIASKCYRREAMLWVGLTLRIKTHLVSEKSGNCADLPEVRLVTGAIACRKLTLLLGQLCFCRRSALLLGWLLVALLDAGSAAWAIVVPISEGLDVRPPGLLLVMHGHIETFSMMPQGPIDCSMNPSA